MSATAKVSREISFRRLERREDIVALEQINQAFFAGILGLSFQTPMYACPNRVFTPRSRAKIVTRRDGKVQTCPPEVRGLREVVR